MKLIRKDEQKVVFHLSQREKARLLEVLKLYPVLSASFQPLSKADDSEKVRANQELLELSLVEHKELNRQFLQKLFAKSERLQEDKSGWRLLLEAGEVDWFLQVLNDIRVGKWYLAGCPDESEGRPLNITPANLEHQRAIEVAGFFQAEIIEALEEFGY